MKNIRYAFFVFFCLSVFSFPNTALAIDGQTVLDQLLEDNQHFVTGYYTSLERNYDRVDSIETDRGGNSWAVVFFCSEAMNDPQIFFEAKPSQLSVVRIAGPVIQTAGTVPTDPMIGTLMHLVQKQDIPLIFVLGHKNCGVVQSVVSGEKFGGFTGSLLETLHVALTKVGTANYKPEDLVDAVSVQNVKSIVEVLPPVLNRNQLRVVGGMYDTEDNRVEIIK